MSYNKLFLGLCAAVVFCNFALSARLVTVQPVADLKPTGSGVWNLSSFEPVGSEIDIRILEGDSLTRVWLPDTRFDFLTAGDTIALACEETRVFRLDFSPASAETRIEGSDKALFTTFTASGRMYQSEFISAEGCSAVMPSERIAIISYSGNTITGGRLERSTRTLRWSLSTDSTLSVTSLPDSLVGITHIERLRLTAPGETFPRALKKNVTTSWCGQTISADSSAWILTSAVTTPPRIRRNDPRDIELSLFDPDGSQPDVTITTTPDAIIIFPTDSEQGSTALRIAVNDISGRSYIDTLISSAVQSTVDTSSLPRGEYLIQILDGSTPVAVVKYIKQ